MKKLIIVIFSIILIFLLIFPHIYQSTQIKKLETVFFNTLNGYEITDKLDKRVLKSCKEYQNENLISDDSLYLLLKGVSSFESYLEDAEKINNLFEENPFLNIEEVPFGTQEEFEKYYSYYSADVLSKDNRIIIKDDNYYIRFTDLDFSKNNYDLVTYGNFQRFIMESEIEGETFSERQKESPFVTVGHLRNGNIVKYSYIDKRTNSVLNVDVVFGPFFVKSCEIH